MPSGVDKLVARWAGYKQIGRPGYSDAEMSGNEIQMQPAHPEALNLALGRLAQLDSEARRHGPRGALAATQADHGQSHDGGHAAETPARVDSAADVNGHGHLYPTCSLTPGGSAVCAGYGDDAGCERNGERAARPPETWTRRRDLKREAVAAIWQRRWSLTLEQSSSQCGLLILLSSAYVLAEMAVGITSGSLAVQMDAFRMLTYVSTLACSRVAAQRSLGEHTAAMSFGWQRAELVGAFCNGCFLLAICFTYTLDTVRNLAGISGGDSAALVLHADKILVLGCIGAVINLSGMRLLGANGHTRSARRQGLLTDARGVAREHAHAHAHTHAAGGSDCAGNTTGRRGSRRPEAGHLSTGHFINVFGDAVISFLVVANGSVLKHGRAWGDRRLLAEPLAALMICCVILVKTVPLIRTACDVLMDSSPGVCVCCLWGRGRGWGWV